jgi:SAM-dependent MidA family methyltransferase
MQTEAFIRNDLPEPDAPSAAHSERVAGHIRDVIELAGGSISFAEFMQHALYAPGLGYYSAGARKLGTDGDFVTAPEISPLFGHVLARQSAFVLDQLGGGAVLEPGAGSGALAVSMLSKLDELGALPDRYLILEVSADLRERQEARINLECPQHRDRVSWIAGLPEDFEGVVVANEVADAFPVERFRIQDGEVLQARVVTDGRRFAWQFSRAPDLLCDAVRELEADTGRALGDGYESEVSPGLRNWVTDLCASVRKGLVLLVDYGVTRREYYAPDRGQGWLRCHFRHRAHDDPLILPGIQDLTAWVDFSMVAAAASNAGMSIAGFVTQAQLLIDGGLEKELAEFNSMPVARQVKLSGQVKLLTLPSEMGENFKCLGLQRGALLPPPALIASDRAHLL